jgi:hypothetical protein
MEVVRPGAQYRQDSTPWDDPLTPTEQNIRKTVCDARNWYLDSPGTGKALENMLFRQYR